MLENDQISEVELTENQIFFESIEDGDSKIFTTGIMPDPT